VTTDITGFEAKEQGWNRSESIWFKCYAKQHMDWTGKARGL